MLRNIDGTVIQGHQVASGNSKTTPYPDGTIALQIPYFRALGLDLSGCHLGTLNLQLPISAFDIIKADFTFEKVKWIEGFNPETFSFVACQIRTKQLSENAWLYFPHPETKMRHHQKANMLEILAPTLPGLGYGDTITFTYDTNKLTLHS